MELSKRLKAVADLVSAGSIVCDAGCDHGYVPIYLVQRGICHKAIAADVNAGPLARAKDNIRAYGLEEYITTRLSDGVSALEAGEADALILAGMGGRLVIKILQEGCDVIARMREVILQPQSDIALVRSFLREIRWCIVREDMVYEDGKYYPMMKAQPEELCREAAYAYGEHCRLPETAEGCQRQKTSGECQGQETAEACQEQETAGEAVRQQAFDCYGRYLLEHRHPVLRQFLLWEQERESGILQRLAQGRDPERVRELLKAEQVRKYALSYFGEAGAKTAE